MSKEEQQEPIAQSLNSSEEPSQNASQAEPLSPGRQLVAGRKALGLTQQQIADRLHLRLSSVQAVEKDELEEGVSVTFNKGYVRLYAKLVQLDIQPLLDSYDRMHIQDNKPAKLQSFSRRVTREAHDHRWNMVTIVVVILVLGSVVGWWVQQSDSFKDSQAFVAETFEKLFSDSEQSTELQTQDALDKTETIDNQLIETNTLVESGDMVNDELGNSENKLPEIQTPITDDSASTDDSINQVTDELIPQDLGQSMLDTIDEVEDTLNETGDMVEEQLTVDDQAPKRNSADIIEGVFTEDGYRVNSDGTVDLVFTFEDDCWVSVKDKNGDTIAYGVKKKGRVMEVSGIPPINVVLGAPQNVQINFGGLEVDMSVFPGGRSANFDLPIGSE